MSTARICTHCNAVVPEEHHYCGRCGSLYSEDGREIDDDTLFFGAMQAPGRAKLILIRGEGLEGLSYHLNATEHVAGRNSGAILFPEDEYISHKHATFLYKANKLFVRDEKSENGTFLAIRERVKLSDGDQFKVGHEFFRLERLELKQEYPMKEGTLMYVSPPKEYVFRIVHILEGDRDGAAYCSSANELTIGREGTDILCADDRHVSKLHARVFAEDGEIYLEDLESKNGTFLRVNGEAALEHSDYVFLGSELMRVEING